MQGALAQLIDRDRQHRRALAMWEELRRDLPGKVDPSLGGLTICSVAFRAKGCLDLNADLTERLNPGVATPDWLLFDNNVEESEKISAGQKRFTVVRPARRDVDMGYEHALGISALLTRVRTRFLLIQDPDCFVVRPDWIRAVQDHMIARNLGFFGTPINPRRHNSYRYFPYMVCMFVDLSRVALADLCFVPDVWRLETSVGYQVRRTLASIPKLGFVLRGLLTEQWKTNGWRIKDRFGDGRLTNFECVQPVWDTSDTIPPGSLKKRIHDLTPGSFAPVPKQPGYCSPTGFAQMNAPDLAAIGWEEFVWQDRPFAFHVGSVHAKPGQYESQLERVVQDFGAARPAPALAHAR